ncbi:FAD-binding oxidoreductase, partial [Cypionkella sp.]|uniref:FAD-binding oxidoreductase n=1 Tax=Cypionkella sp. TaxID=2811411 RepID=UPI00275F3D62|nr:2-hydroxy-acid oxidase [Cypionkella sp.]
MAVLNPIIDALADLRSFLGDRLSTAAPILAQHAQSETHITARAPDAVAFPNSTEEVARIAAVCASHAMPMVGWGAGSSLEGHAL